MGVVLGKLQLSDNFTVHNFMQSLKGDYDDVKILDGTDEDEELYLIDLGKKFALYCEDGQKINPIGLTLISLHSKRCDAKGRD